MFAALVTILVLTGFLLTFPVLTVFLQVLMALPMRTANVLKQARPPVAALVPAHDEELVIGETLASICSQLDREDRLLVVADNCSDRTAEIARSSGAEVTIRTDPTLRGKGFALDYGLRFLEQTGFRDTVIFIDADCKLMDGCIDRLAQACAQSGRPTQAAYLMTPPQPASKTALLILFAWMVKDFVRPLGLHRMNLPCQLAGSGMAFPWEVLRSVNLASTHLAEDLKLGLDLALGGHFPQFCPDAVVTSKVAVGGTPSVSQRERWEHGTMDAMVRYLPRLLISSSKARSIWLLTMALDLSVPPLALLALMLSAYLVLSLALLLISGAKGPALVSCILCALFFLSIVTAWRRYGREMLPLYVLVLAPIYAIKKIPLYVKFLLNRQREWVKSERKFKQFNGS